MNTQQPITISLEQWTDLTNTISHTSTMIVDIHTRLFGNGQPGELDKLDGRVRELESVTNHWKGVITAVSAVLGLFGGTEILHIWGKI